MRRGASDCIVVVAMFLAVLAAHPRCIAAEPWADEGLKVTDGLVLWLDAARQDRAYAASRLPVPASGAPLPVWFDGSGRSSSLIQRQREAWPRLLASGGRATVRFDGQDDRLENPAFAKDLERATIFLLAAPRSNLGGFRGLLAVNELARRDYESGFTVDLGPAPTDRFEALNVEGKNFGGASDLLDDASPFGTYHTIEARIDSGPQGVRLWIDGKMQKGRDRSAGSIGADELTLGARFYSNDASPNHLQGFFDGDIAEVLLFNRTLDDAETNTVRDYLSKKQSGLAEALAPLAHSLGRPYRMIADPPPVQFLVPGFAVRELPVKLRNINNIRYRRDGKLVALAYDGDVLLLSDRDGDGLEEHVETFWENKGRLWAPIGMALMPANFPARTGVCVASKGKISLIVDEDGDDRAEREIVIADGWKEADHGVDALGVAIDGEGGVYFGLGTPSFTDPYLLGGGNQASYDPKGQKGSIQRIAPGFKSREIIATGVRFPVALAFNKAADLFATDQEGATWLANGNPFDELLHIERGRHYGFPPRHPRYLPNVLDEPSVFDYSPQHQSTCGLIFNEGVNGGPAFGPSWWADDAIVCGYSRGKLFRTKLVKTPSGYVGQKAILAVLQKLVVDSCVSPRGALVVATHSGGPDWGSGPNGPGTLYKITYNDRDAPQPVLAWAASAREVRVVFDRPIASESLRDLIARTSISCGKSVSEGERFETLRPGYAVVAAQVAEARFDVPIRSVAVTPDRRTLLIGIDAQTEPFAYAITLPRLSAAPKIGGIPGELRQESTIDLGYCLDGVQAEWRSDSGDRTWSGWLPHLDLDVSRTLTAGSASHDALWLLLRTPGKLTMSCALDLKDMLRPAVQPGSRVDDALPRESVVLDYSTNRSVAIRLSTSKGVTTSASEFTPEGIHQKGIAGGSDDIGKATSPIDAIVTLTTVQGDDPRFQWSYRTNEDKRPRALPLRRFRLPWVRPNKTSVAEAPSVPAELAGGSWSRGRALFFEKEARCASCHAIRGEGGKIGPDLSNLPQRDYASVLRDIREPSYAINPDHIAYAVALNDGRILSGTIRSEGDRLKVGDAEGRETPISRSEVEAMTPLSISIMPEGLPKTLGDRAMADLLTFLLTADPQPAPIQRSGMPPARTRDEVDAVLGSRKVEAKGKLRPLHILLVSGPKDHGVDEHDYPVWQRRWTDLLGRAEGVTVTTAEVWPTPAQFSKADVIAWYSANPGWSGEKAAELDAFLDRGGGMVYLHFAVNGRNAPEALSKRIGFAWRDGLSKFRHGPLDLSFGPVEHPISAGFAGKPLHLEDESYWNLAGDAEDVNVLASAMEDGKARPLFWTKQTGKGRVFVSIPGHYTWTFDDPLFRVLILRGLAWSAHEPVNRFDSLATIGARMKGP